MKHICTKIIVAVASIVLITPLAGARVTADNSVALGKPAPEIPAQANAETGVRVGEEVLVSGITAETTNPLAMKLAPRQTAEKIRSAAFDLRDQTLQSVENKVDEAHAAVAEIIANAQALQGEVRDQVRASIARVDEAQKDLLQTIEEARNARPEEWSGLRTKLADHFEAFAEAAVNADVTAEAVRGKETRPGIS